MPHGPAVKKMLEAFNFGQMSADMQHFDSAPQWLRQVIVDACQELEAKQFLSDERIHQIIVIHCNGQNFGRIMRAIKQVLAENENPLQATGASAPVTTPTGSVPGASDAV